MKASFSHTSYMYRHTKLFWKSYYLLRPVQKLWEILISLVFTNNYITSKILALNIPLANFYLQLLEPTYFSLLSLKSFNLIQSSKSLIPPLSTILPTPPSYAHISPCLAQVPGSKFNHSLNCFSPCYSVFLVFFFKAQKLHQTLQLLWAASMLLNVTVWNRTVQISHWISDHKFQAGFCCCPILLYFPSNLTSPFSWQPLYTSSSLNWWPGLFHFSNIKCINSWDYILHLPLDNNRIIPAPI